MSTFQRDLVLHTVMGTFGYPSLLETQAVVIARDDGETMVCIYQGEKCHSNEGQSTGVYTDYTLLDLASFQAIADTLKERGLI